MQQLLGNKCLILVLSPSSVFGFVVASGFGVECSVVGGAVGSGLGVVVAAGVGVVECACVGCTVVIAGSKIGGCAVVTFDADTGAVAGFAGA